MNVKRHVLLAAGLAAIAVGVWAGPPHRHHHPRGSVGFGLYFGIPWAYPPYYPYPYWPRVYVPPVAPVIVAPPPVYVEQPGAPLSVPVLEPGFWYYCNEAQAYYPYVKQCPGSWQKVAPQPQQ